MADYKDYFSDEVFQKLRVHDQSSTNENWKDHQL